MSPLSCLSALKPGPHLPLLLLHLQISKPGRADPPTPPSSPAFLSQRHSQIRITPPLPTLSSLFLPPLCFFPLSLPLCLCGEPGRFFLCLRLTAWSSQLQRQAGQLPEVEDGAEEEEEAAAAAAGAGAQEKSRYGKGRRGKSARRRRRRPTQRWHIWNTI